MRIHKTVWVAALAGAILWSAPALAGHGKGLHFGNTKGNKAKVSATSSDAESGETGETLNGSHSNKGGELRGLNRANAAAGEHGEAGRTNAASTHGHSK